VGVPLDDTAPGSRDQVERAPDGQLGDALPPVVAVDEEARAPVVVQDVGLGAVLLAVVDDPQLIG